MVSPPRLQRPGDFQIENRWHGLDYASVTTTENFVLCAVLASGTSTLMNAASEPHVQEFCAFLTQLGARIEGIGTSRLAVLGVDEWCGGEFSFAEDFHEIVTFLALGVKAQGSVMFWNKVYDGALGWTSELSKFGAQAFQSDPHRIVTFGGKPLVPAEVEAPTSTAWRLRC